MVDEKTNVTEDVKRAKPSDSIVSGLSDCRSCLSNAIFNDEIMTALKRFAISTEKLEAGVNLIDETITLNSDQKREQGESAEASAEFKKMVDKSKDDYMDFLSIARYIFKDDPNAKKSLLLNGSRKHAFAAWSENAKLFYANALGSNDIKNTFAANGITEEMLKEMQSNLLDTIDYRVITEKEKTEALRATEVRNMKLEEVDDFMSWFKTFAKVALKGRGDLLKQVGL